MRVILILCCAWPLLTGFSQPMRVPHSLNYAAGYAQSAEHQQALRERNVKIERGCIRKAMYGENVAVNKMHNIPLREIISEIRAIHRIQREAAEPVPWYVFVEMQRIARDAYRRNFPTAVQVNQFASDVYYACVETGW